MAFYSLELISDTTLFVFRIKHKKTGISSYEIFNPCENGEGQKDNKMDVSPLININDFTNPTAIRDFSTDKTKLINEFCYNEKKEISTQTNSFLEVKCICSYLGKLCPFCQNSAKFAENMPYMSCISLEILKDIAKNNLHKFLVKIFELIADGHEVHEVVFNKIMCSPYFDIDYYSKDDYDESKFRVFLDTLNLCCLGFTLLKNSPIYIEQSSIKIACASRSVTKDNCLFYKNSYHVMIDCITFSGGRLDCKLFANFVKFYMPDHSEIIDMRVYDHNSNFRVPYCKKNEEGPESILLPWNCCSYVQMLITTQKNRVISAVEILPQSYVKNNATDENSVTSKVTKFCTANDIFSLLCEESEYTDLFCKLKIRNGIKSDSYIYTYIPLARTLKNDPITCPICLRDHVNENVYLVVTPKTTTCAAIYLKCYRFDSEYKINENNNLLISMKNESTENKPGLPNNSGCIYLGHIILFICDNGQEKLILTKNFGVEEKKYVISKIQEINFLDEYKIENIKMNYPSMNIIIGNEEKVANLAKKSMANIQFIQSGTGTGKTDYVKELITKRHYEDIICITARRTLVIYYMEALKDEGFCANFDPYKSKFPDSNRIVTVVNSLHKVKNRKFQLVIIDESVFTIKQLQMVDHDINDICAVLHFLMFWGEKIIIMDAHNDLNAILPYMSISNPSHEVDLLVNRFKRGKDQNWHFTWNENIMLYELVKAVKNNETIFVCCTTKCIVEAISNHIEPFLLPGQVISLVGSSPIKEKKHIVELLNSNTNIGGALIFSTVIVIGVSTMGHVDKVFSFHSNPDVSILEVFQQTQRARLCKDFYVLLGRVPPNFAPQTYHSVLHQFQDFRSKSIPKSLPYSLNMERNTRIILKSPSLNFLVSGVAIFNEHTSSPEMTMVKLVCDTGAKINILDNEKEYKDLNNSLYDLKGVIDTSKRKKMQEMINDSFKHSNKDLSELMIVKAKQQEDYGQAETSIENAITIRVLCKFYLINWKDINVDVALSLKSGHVKGQYANLRILGEMAYDKENFLKKQLEKDYELEYNGSDVYLFTKTNKKSTSYIHFKMLFDVCEKLGLSNNSIFENQETLISVDNYPFESKEMKKFITIFGGNWPKKKDTHSKILKLLKMCFTRFGISLKSQKPYHRFVLNSLFNYVEVFLPEFLQKTPEQRIKEAEAIFKETEKPVVFYVKF